MASTKFVTDLVPSDVKQAPSDYIANLYDTPNLSEVQVFDGFIPLIDLQALQGSRRSDIIKQIRDACEEYGFFMVKNHGISESTVEDALGVAKEFFKLPESERLKFYADGTRKSISLSSGFNAKTQKVSHWKDTMRFRCHPVQDYVHQWPSNPPSFRKDMGEYCSSVRGLAFTLLEAISESLGLEKEYISKALKTQAQNMALDYYFDGVNLNYYPPCPQPELTCGSPGHTDPSVITVLMPDTVPGLQIVKNGKWLAVNPVPNTFIINVGDMMQVLSNDRYKSVRHRAVVNSERERLSIAAFFFPSPEAMVGPPEELIDEDHPAVYRSFQFKQFFAKVSGGSDLPTKRPLDLFTF